MTDRQLTNAFILVRSIMSCMHIHEHSGELHFKPAAHIFICLKTAKIKSLCFNTNEEIRTDILV